MRQRETNPRSQDPATQRLARLGRTAARCAHLGCATLCSFCLAVPSAANARPLQSSNLPFILAVEIASGITAVDARSRVRIPIFLDAFDAPLTLSEDELLDFLHSAPVTASRTLATGINKSRKLTLSQNGITAHAIFRTVDVTHSQRRNGSSLVDFYVMRDYHAYEVAAYRMSRLLGIDRVPPVVLRTINGERGSLQLWIENARTEHQALAEGIALEKPTQRYLQRQLMYGFDQLIFNFDRHAANVLYDEADRMWFIDHTRSFRLLPRLAETQLPILCDREFCEALRALSPDRIRDEMKGVLNSLETEALIKRRKLLLDHFDHLVNERGRDSVLVDLNGGVTHSPTTPDFPLG